MVIYDEITMQKVFDPDLQYGTVVENHITVLHRWVVDSPAVEEEYVITEYENGGKDVGYRIIEQEVGHWETYGPDGILSDYDGWYLDEWKEHGGVEDTWAYGVYHTYTDEELAEIEAARVEQERRVEQQELIESLPDAVADLSEMVSDNTVDVADIMDAVADLSGMVSDNTVDMADVMDAIAELSEIVSNLMEGE